MSTFFTSDTHFGHRNIIKYCNRPFIDGSLDKSDVKRYLIKEMDAFLIAKWNSVVRPGDTVYHLGDFAYATTDEHVYDCMRQLNGSIHFIEGNHDALAGRMHTGMLSPHRFASWAQMREITVEDQKIVLCHYAIREWHHALRGTWHLFGHTHATLAPFGKSFDVGVDNASTIAPGYDFCPLSFGQIKAYADTLPIGPHPGFDYYQPSVL